MQQRDYSNTFPNFLAGDEPIAGERRIYHCDPRPVHYYCDPTTFAMRHQIPPTVTGLDGYARDGVAVSRDAAHRILAALRRDAYDMRARGGGPNHAAANANDALADAIGKAMVL